MDLSQFVGRSFFTQADGKVTIITSVNADSLYFTTGNTSGNVLYIGLKNYYDHNLIQFIDADSWTNFGSKILYDATSLFVKAEGVILKNDTQIFWDSACKPLDLKNNVYSGFDMAYFPKCECGGKKIGLKDYQIGHAGYCNVYHGNKK